MKSTLRSGKGRLPATRLYCKIRINRIRNSFYIACRDLNEHVFNGIYTFQTQTPNTPAVLHSQVILSLCPQSKPLLPLTPQSLQRLKIRRLPRPLPPTRKQLIHILLKRYGLEVRVQLPSIKVPEILCILQRAILTDELRQRILRVGPRQPCP